MVQYTVSVACRRQAQFSAGVASDANNLGNQPFCTLGQRIRCKGNSERGYDLPLRREKGSRNTTRIVRKFFAVDAVALTHDVVQFIYELRSLHNGVRAEGCQRMNVEVPLHESRVTIGQQ